MSTEDEVLRQKRATCQRCGVETHGGGHLCPHGNRCFHRADWTTPECALCCPPNLRHVPLFQMKYETPWASDAGYKRDHNGLNHPRPPPVEKPKPEPATGVDLWKRRIEERKKT